jgi:hypothetical protein
MNRILSVRPGNFELGIPILLFVQEFTERRNLLRLDGYVQVFVWAGLDT